jgi:ABC-2 type transport system ATP-binding protein
MANLLEIKEVTKYYGSLRVFENISFAVRQKEIFGFLGLNGAGKTTLIKCIVKLLAPSAGSIYFKEKPLTNNEIYRYFGYLPESFIPPREFSGREFLRILAASLSVAPSKADGLLAQVKLDPHKRIRNYSRGMIQRLGLATALLKDPECIILDEPTLGLDPVSQVAILSLLTDLNRQGKTILFSSHNLFHMEKICHRIGLLHEGRMKFVGTVEEINGAYRTGSLEEAFLKEVTAHA